VNSKERVQAAFSGSEYDRLPMWFGAEPDTTKNVMNLLDVETEEEVMQCLGADFRTIRPRYIGPELRRYEDGTFDTMWGIKRGNGYWGIALNTPLEFAETVRDVKEYP